MDRGEAVPYGEERASPVSAHQQFTGSASGNHEVSVRLQAMTLDRPDEVVEHLHPLESCSIGVGAKDRSLGATRVPHRRWSRRGTDDEPIAGARKAECVPAVDAMAPPRPLPSPPPGRASDPLTL